eukprot:3823881-Rhodomonas_salina.1
MPQDSGQENDQKECTHLPLNRCTSVGMRRAIAWCEHRDAGTICMFGVGRAVNVQGCLRNDELADTSMHLNSPPVGRRSQAASCNDPDKAGSRVDRMRNRKARIRICL